MSDFTIIENSREAQNEYGHNYGSEDFHISREDIEALLNGKQLAAEVNARRVFDIYNIRRL